MTRSPRSTGPASHHDAVNVMSAKVEESSGKSEACFRLKDTFGGTQQPPEALARRQGQDPGNQRRSGAGAAGIFGFTRRRPFRRHLYHRSFRFASHFSLDFIISSQVTTRCW